MRLTGARIEKFKSYSVLHIFSWRMQSCEYEYLRLFRIICVGIVAFGVLGTLVYVGARHMKATADERDPFGSSAGK